MLNRDHPDLEEVARLKQEYEFLSSIESSGVVEAAELVQHGGAIALVLEDFEGQSLRSLGIAGGMELPECLSLAAQIARALCDIHDRRIVHKDIGPANIVWNRASNVVKIIDFNIAEEVLASTNSILSTGVLEGTLAYMSPEQTGRMNRTIDFRSDLYSLGVTLYELLTGRLPFEFTGAMELVHAHMPGPRSRFTSCSTLCLRLFRKSSPA